MPGLIVRDDAVIEPSALGYSDAAIASYEVFRQLRSEGVIPAGVRFQVSLPTPYAVAIAWGALGSQEAFLRAYKPALFGELATIMAAIPGRDLIIQWDVAVEIGALEGAFVVDGDLGTFARIAAELRDCLEHSAQDSAEPAEIGLHLCYGDYQHRHFAVPSDLGLLVQIANAVGPVDFVHFPVDRQTGLDGAYFTPLRQLSFETIISLGVIDYEQEPGRTDALVAAARSGGSDFLVATECGMGRVGERGEAVSVEQLLADHARVIGTA
jgi:methionine synthase II (cobalamin-independent)